MATLQALIGREPFASHFAGSKLDPKSPEYKLAVDIVGAEVMAVKALLEDLRKAMKTAVAGDLAGLSPYQLPRKGYLTFGPIHVYVHPEAAARPRREPRRLWHCDLMVLKSNDAEMCHVFIAVYSILWEDFPEVASRIQALLDFRAGFVGRVSPVVLAIHKP